MPIADSPQQPVSGGPSSGGPSTALALFGANPLDFAPALLRIQDRPPSPLAGWCLRLLLALFAGVLLWAAFGRLDIVAVAEGKIVPDGYLQIVQSPEQGIVRDILVREGERVAAGQVLVRMDPVISNADAATLTHEYHVRATALRRIDAQLSGRPLARKTDDLPDVHAQAVTQYAANLQAYGNALAHEEAVREKAENDLAAAREARIKLERTLPLFVAAEAAYDKLVKEGFAGNLMAADKQRERIEREQDLKAQDFVIRSNLALIAQSERRTAQITADYRRQLQTERLEAVAQSERLKQDLAKHRHRQGMLELRAPQAGTVKDLATHTAGTVAAPGTILMTLVPEGESVFAEVWLGNQDVGLVRAGQDVKVKLAAFPFQKYGMVEGRVKQVSADATDMQASPAPLPRGDAQQAGRLPGLAFRTIVHLQDQELVNGDTRYPLVPGMQVSAEINLGTRTVLEYLLSPVRKVVHEAGRER